MIVVDVNVIAYLLIAGDKTQLAQQVYQKEPSWFAPTLWRHEFLNILATFVRHGGGKLSDVESIWQQATTQFSQHQREVEMLAALQLATQHNISAYDAQYIALAHQLNTVCVSEDQKLAKAFPSSVKSMQDFTRESRPAQ
jgi:predicted nucleic acid-binding protein